MSNESPYRLRGVPHLPAPQPIRSYLIANLCAAATAALILLVWLVAPYVEARAAGPAPHRLIAIRQITPSTMIRGEATRDSGLRTHRSSPAPCRTPETADGCPEAQQTLSDLPQSLSSMLHNTAYTPGRVRPVR